MRKDKKMKIYTKRGDKGWTSMIDKKNVSKDNPRVCAYGDIDELNSVVGICVCKVNISEIKDVLLEIQKDLFAIGSILAGYKNLGEKVVIDEKKILKMEKKIDEIQDKLEALNKFILPGGREGGAYLHLARAVARRAERSIVKICKKNKYSIIIKYLNRLSDLLFVLARYENKLLNTPEEIW